MDGLGNEAITVLQYLLPGFFAAWVFYGFTSFPLPPQFERVVQALIFTLIIQAIVYLEKLFLYDNGSVLATWDDNTQLLAATLTAFAMGLVFTYCANTDVFHALMRRIGISKETSYPSEWFGAFQNVTYVVLHFRDKRRLYGWPRVWPTDPGEGHFIIEEPSWLTAAGQMPLSGVSSIVVNVKDVRWVEFMSAKTV
jgi:hypothetical protein